MPRPTPAHRAADAVASALAYLTRTGHRPVYRPDTLADVARKIVAIEERRS